jgi:putative tricarboxylic transport membrane protein
MIEPLAQQERRRRPERAVLAIAAGLIALAALVAWDSSRLGAGGAYARIGPQTIPYAIAICLAGLGVWTIVAAYRHDFPRPERQELAPVLWIVGGLLAQILLLKIAGFSIATGLLFAMTARGLGRVRPAVALIAGVLISAAVWFVFARLLQLTLPAGAIEHLMLQGADLIVAPFKAAAVGKST